MFDQSIHRLGFACKYLNPDQSQKKKLLEESQRPLNTRALRPGWKKYNSSVIRFNSGQLDHLWQDFKQNRTQYQRKFYGDQDWLYAVADKKPMFWPESWILSWKWEIRKSRQFAPGGTRGNRRFKDIEDVKPRPECCVTVFHGDPNPELVEDPWVKQNWK